MSQPPQDLPGALADAKTMVWHACEELISNPARSAQSLLTDDCLWVLSHPFNELRGPEAVNATYLQSLCKSFPDIERRTDLFFAGHWDGRLDGGAGIWVTCTGHYLGTFRASFAGIPASGDVVWLRFGEFYRVVEGRIAEARIVLDLVDLARQSGVPILPHGAGQEILVPGPRKSGRAVLLEQMPLGQRACLDVVEKMIEGLGRYDRQDLSSMGMERFWQPNMMWYGPGGIGTTRTISGFQKYHQAPFLHAFPDRKGGWHRARIGEGRFAASTGWPSVRATHAGRYLGEDASGRSIGMRVMDWWRLEGELLAENWVLIDLPHLFLQMGVDLLARAGAPAQ